MSTPTDSPKPLQLLHTLELDVNIFDTDCYGVMWHGAYTKWLEMGRVKLLEAQGYRFSKPGEVDGFVFPVVEQNLKYKRPAPYGDKLTLTTRVALQGYKLIFLQSFLSHQSDQITVEATTTVVTVDAQWKLQRRLPQSLKEILGL
ncbi:acyl-CoA thioesterase [Vampirovibrio sp.]|uniref:acyl-CoA thioesterase n=1 Tax=Vampirovibrio sp. TaxID=2717857 RepID=UPI0035941235